VHVCCRQGTETLELLNISTTNHMIIYLKINYVYKFKIGELFFDDLTLLLFFYRYTANLVHAKKINVKRGFLTGLGFGFLWFFIYASYALAFWYGVGLVLDDKQKPEEEKVYTATTMVTVRNCA
jgi:hypothetical protein